MKHLVALDSLSFGTREKRHKGKQLQHVSRKDEYLNYPHLLFLIVSSLLFLIVSSCMLVLVVSCFSYNSTKT